MGLFGLKIIKQNAYLEAARKESLKVRQMRSQINFTKLELELDKIKAKQQTAETMDPRIKAFMDSPEQAIMMILLEKFLSNNTPEIVATENLSPIQDGGKPLSTQKELSFTDEQIKGMVDNIPANTRKKLKGMPDDKVKEIIINYIPMISKPNVEQAIKEMKK